MVQSEGRNDVQLTFFTQKKINITKKKCVNFHKRTTFTH